MNDIKLCDMMVDFLRDVSNQLYGNAIHITFSNPKNKPTFNLAFYIGNGYSGSWKHLDFCPFCGQQIDD